MLRATICSLFAAALAAQSPLQSTFVGGLQISNPGPPAATALFDLTVSDPTGIVIRQIDCNINTNSGTNGTLGVWVTAPGGTHVNNHLNAAVWTQVASASRTHTGGRTVFVLPTPFHLAAGTYGVALHHVGMNPVYTNPATATPPLPTTYSTLEATLDMIAARVRTSTVASPFGGTAAGFTPRQPNIALHYVSGPVFADFEGVPNRGASPLPVQFTSFAVSANPGGIFAYLWDLDGDNVIDSTLPNPQFTYTNCGNYTVSLTIVDSVTSTTVTKTNYVQTDVVVPGFTNALVAPNVVQFTDTSSPPAQTWAWDLDGDNVIDSILQNPLFVYTNACDEVMVTLTVTRACQPPVVLQKRIAVATSAETIFQGGLVITTTSPGGTNFFDVDVTNPLGVTICGMHVNSSVPNGSPVTVKVHQKVGTYAGNVENAALWRLVGNTVTTSRGTGQRTFASFSPPIHLAAGVNGIGIELVGGSPSYTNLGVMQTFPFADLTITAGLVQAVPIFGPAATSTQFTPRIWNGALHFATSQAASAPGYGFIGGGCAGTLGVPGNVATTQPVLGGAATIVVDKLPLDLGIMALGVSRTVSAIGPLPIDLGFLGMPGCPLRVSFEATATLFGAANTATLVFPVPSSVSLIGVQLYSQALSFDPLLNAFGFAISDAAVMLVGQ